PWGIGTRPIGLPPSSGLPGPIGPPSPPSGTPPPPPPPPVPAPSVGSLGPLLQRGNLEVRHELDLDLSPGSDVGGSPALVYNSERVNVKPIIQATVLSDNSTGVALPATITATLTFNGTTQ